MKYLIANWKMNSVDIDVWEQEFINVVSSQNNFPKSDEVKLIVCLNLYDYTVFSEKIKNSKNEIFNKISLFAQDVSQYDEGAFTGQISSKFLKAISILSNISLICSSLIISGGQNPIISPGKALKITPFS